MERLRSAEWDLFFSFGSLNDLATLALASTLLRDAVSGLGDCGGDGGGGARIRGRRKGVYPASCLMQMAGSRALLVARARPLTAALVAEDRVERGGGGRSGLEMPSSGRKRERGSKPGEWDGQGSGRGGCGRPGQAQAQALHFFAVFALDVNSLTPTRWLCSSWTRTHVQDWG